MRLTTECLRHVVWGAGGGAALASGRWWGCRFARLMAGRLGHAVWAADECLGARRRAVSGACGCCFASLGGVQFGALVLFCELLCELDGRVLEGVQFGALAEVLFCEVVRVQFAALAEVLLLWGAV